ncbi:MAG TPA: ectonucleotide pyrophosphatase/phosphodiesterase [Rhizomicrobium sp.]|jgi:predicted AlkP superfamily pyrophosphatase or phosphodiesterase|nr:ectonucleotide pyrophosphatase/phosphodiesterase [Rhizomicrobium sp.]
MKILSFLCAALLALPVTTATAKERTVVVVLFDGFSPASLDATHTPNFDLIKKDGAWSRHLVPAFPTISLINHTTFETGCWPSHHGIVSNFFFDPKKGEFPQSDDAAWRTGCETMWEAAERQGVRTAAFNIVGRWSSTKGKRATTINPNVPWKNRESDEKVLERGLAALRDHGPNHARLIALYFPIPDEEAHWNGTTAPKTEDAVRKADAIVGKLMAAIRALPPSREATLVVGTDHGMMDVGPVVNIGRILGRENIHARQASDGATTFLYLRKGETKEHALSALAKYRYAFDAYPKGKYPAYAHLGDGARSGDILIVCKPPYWVAGPEAFPWYARWLGLTHFWPETFTPAFGGLKATHGYDPHIVQMHGIFFAWGAGVAHGKQIPRLDMIDVHPTVMSLLELQPGEPVDGHAIELSH